jgi:hypothetical protein
LVVNVFVNVNGALRKFESFWFPVVPGPPPGLGNSQAGDEDVLTTLWASEPDAHVHITWSPTLMFVVVGEKKSLPTDTLATAADPERGQNKQGKNVAKMAGKCFWIGFLRASQHIHTTISCLTIGWLVCSKIGLAFLEAA